MQFIPVYTEKADFVLRSNIKKKEKNPEFPKQKDQSILHILKIVLVGCVVSPKQGQVCKLFFIITIKAHT